MQEKPKHNQYLFAGSRLHGIPMPQNFGSRAKKVSIQSMTGYGSASLTVGNFDYHCEIRSLNSRFLEVFVKLPRPLIKHEIPIINTVKERLARGKVDVFFELVPTDRNALLPSLDPSSLTHYAREFEKAAKLFATVPTTLDLTSLITLEGVITNSNKKDNTEHGGGLLSVFKIALQNLESNRKKEGLSLQGALLCLFKELEEARLSVETLRAGVLAGLAEQVKKRIDNALLQYNSALPITSERLATEIALASDKADIEEELTRLKTHIQEGQRCVTAEHPIGKKLDFLCQEMHREVNTMSVKLVQTEISQYTLLMKQVVERLRQQVQNIE